ncbi:MAG: MFS transporter [Anaerolineae bacterium]
MTPPRQSLPSPGGAGPFFGVGLRLMGAVFFARFMVDTGTRFLYPFIPQISAGLKLPVAAFGWLLFSRSIVGVAGPLFGVWADRYGRRAVMTAAALALSVGALGLALARQWWAALPIVLAGLGTAAFIPAQQAYIGDLAPGHKRGRAMGAVEFSWSAAAILALPVAGRLVERFGWRTPLFILSLFSLAGAAVVWRQLPPAAGSRTQAGLSWAEIRTVCLKKNVLAAIGVAFFLFAGATAFFTLWGIWLAADFGFDAAAIGLVATGVGVAELARAGFSSLAIDRIGKKRGSGLALVTLVAGFALLPLAQRSKPAAVTALVGLSALLEFAIVSLLPLYSEQAPQARGTALSLVFLGVAAGSGLGAPLATTLWNRFGPAAVAAAITLCLLAALALTLTFLREAPLSAAQTPPTGGPQ